LRIQADSPAHPVETTKGYQICQLKNVGWYVAGLILPTKPPFPARHPPSGAAPNERDAFLKAIMELLPKPKAPATADFPPAQAKNTSEVPAGNTSAAASNDHSSRGVEAGKAPRLEEALAQIDSHLEKNPNHAKAWFRKGLVLISLQRAPDALVAFEKASQLGHKEAVAHLYYWQRKLRC
jgi:tetratricopeptide (TPR) repeat protein